jgi:hypothetical protein
MKKKNSKVLLVIGSRSPLAQTLMLELDKAGLRHLGFSSASGAKNFFSIEEPKLPEELQATHLVIFSWSPSRNHKKQNESFRATQKLSKWAAERDISVLFISSVAAKPIHPTSNYGYFKKKSEECVLHAGQSFLRIGTVVGADKSIGAAADKFLSFPKILRNVLGFLEEFPLPISRLPEITDFVITKWIPSVSPLGSVELISYWSTLQENFNIDSKSCRISISAKIANFFPIQISDRIRVLLDIKNLRLDGTN